MKKHIVICMGIVTGMLTLTGCGEDFGSKMAKAGMNTLMGMGTVFCVLIFIAFLISLFKYISKFENWVSTRSQKDTVITAPAETTDDLPEDLEDDTDDLELVAVITAALAAALDKDADQLIVRSIKRKNTNRW